MANYTLVNSGVKHKKKRKILRVFVLIILSVIILAIALGGWIYWKSMTPTILNIAENRLKSETARAVNEAVVLSLGGNINYSDLVTIEKNSDNEITLITANSSKINTLARDTAILSQDKINRLKSLDVQIPLGTLSGIPLLSEKGPNVNIVVTPIGTVNCTFTSTFETAGINQTLHRVYINVNSKVDLVMPSMHATIDCSTPILLCESLIVGKVPQTYLQGGLLLTNSNI